MSRRSVVVRVDDERTAAATGGYPLGGPCFSALDPGAAILVGSYFRPAFTYVSYFPVTPPRIDALAGVAWRLQVLELPIGGGFRIGEAVELVFGY